MEGLFSTCTTYYDYCSKGRTPPNAATFSPSYPPTGANSYPFFPSTSGAVRACLAQEARHRVASINRRLGSRVQEAIEIALTRILHKGVAVQGAAVRGIRDSAERSGVGTEGPDVLVIWGWE